MKISEVKKELIDFKKSELNLHEKDSKEEIPEEQKQKHVEDIIKKWLNLQKTIKEEITLEDVIIKQQENDRENLKSFFRKFYDLKVNKRRQLEDIKDLKIERKELNIPSYIIEKDVETYLRETCEPIKNLLFTLRNNYDYLIRLLSLIKPDDYNKNINSINSLVELFNNQFYENILIPNPEQQELLILIYKLIEEDIIPMGGVSPDDFLNNNSFLGIFLTSYAQRQEISGYISMILNPLIISIDNDPKDCLDLSIISIKKYLDKAEKIKRTSITSKNEEIKIDFDRAICIKDYLFEKIEKTKIKFKNNFELEAEKEKEDDYKFVSKDDDQLNDSDNNLIYPTKHRNTYAQKPTGFLGNNKDKDYNIDYKYELSKKRLLEKINKENSSEMKQIYIKHLEQLNNHPNKYTNEGLIKILQNELEKRQSLIEVYKDNFVYIKKVIEALLQKIVDKIITFPYPLRCICKLINLLISKKFPYLTKYEVNTYVGKFILEKCLFPVLSLENQNFIDSRVYSSKTKNCLEVIINVLSKANNCSLFDTYADPEKTLFNQFILEIIPILNKFYEKIIDVPLPKVLEDLINKTSKNLEQNLNKKIFNFRRKKKTNVQPVSKEAPKGPDNTKMPPPLFQYFEENNDEILHLQSICFNISDIKFMIDLIGRNIQIFSDLPKYNFFTKTYNRIKNEEQIYTNIINEENNTHKKKFFVIFRDEINAELKNLMSQKKKDVSTFENNSRDSDIICKRIKLCIKTILKGLNLLNNKDFAYLNFAQSSDKFFSALKYTIDELGEYSEISNNIPLKWYSQYIFNYKKELGIDYQKDDFLKLYEEIFTEEANILNELKSLSSTIITRDGMNLRCAEKIIEKAEYELRLIEEAKKYVQVERFINTKKVEVCVMPIEEITNKESIKNEDVKIIINDTKSCQHNNTSNEKNIFHSNNINDFLNKFADKDIQSKIKIKSLFNEDIRKGDRSNQSFAILGKYMEYVKKQIKDPENKEFFGDLKEKEIQEFLEKIENHIIRQLYKYIYPDKKDSKDVHFCDLTKELDFITPEDLEIKKIYVNQLKFAEKYLNEINDAHSVSDKLECIHNAYVTLNNTVKFISGKNEDAGQDELTPLFQYILLKAQPDRLISNINFIRSFVSEPDLVGPKGFFLSQIDSAMQFIEDLKPEQLKMDPKEFEKKRLESSKKHNLNTVDKSRSNAISKKHKN